MPNHNTKKMTKICSTCRKSMDNKTESKTCDSCKQRAAMNRQKARENKIECAAIKDNGKKCTYKVHKDCGNKYCSKHVKEWKEEVQTGGKKVTRCNGRYMCDPKNPGIKAILPENYPHKKCANCLKRERTGDIKRRRKRESFNEKSKNKKCCKKCGKSIPLDKLITTSKGEISYYCGHCFGARKNVEDNRPSRCEEYKTNINLLFYEYLRGAKKRGYNFELSFENFKKLVTSQCYYCDLPRRKYFVGIDRLDNNMGYTKENSVPCCYICNIMKNTLNEATFILMCAHIAHVNHMLKFDTYDYIFNNYKSVFYSGYERGARERNLRFEISKEDFENLIYNNPCYICSRFSSKYHHNGIDRVDNSKGYTLDNCKSCCGDCNFLKRNIDHDTFIYQCAFIAYQHRDRLVMLENKWKTSKFIQRVKNRNKNHKLPIVEV